MWFRKNRPSIPSRILIVKTSAIGDVIQSFPVIAYLKSRFPLAKLSWVVEKGIAPLLRSHPLIDHVIEIDTKSWRKQLFKKRTWKELFQVRKILRQNPYDLVFDLQGNAKSAVFTAFARSKTKVGYSWNTLSERINFFVTNHHIGVDRSDAIINQYLKLISHYLQEELSLQGSSFLLNITPAERSRLDTLISDFQKPVRIMVCFCSRWENKQLSHSTLAAFLHEIKDHLDPFFFFVYGSQQEQERAELLCNAFKECSRTLGGMSLPFWQNLMDAVDLVISVDSAALHLCATTKTPSFSIFGSSSSAVYAPRGSNHTSFQGRCPYNEHFTKRCDHLRTCKTGACMKEIEPAALTKSLLTFWEKLLQTSDR